MVYKKWPALVLFIVAFIILTISGYQCAGPDLLGGIPDRYQQPGDTANSLTNTDGTANTGNTRNPATYNTSTSNLSSTGNTDNTDTVTTEDPIDKCPRKTLRDLERNEGTKATFKFASSFALQDFRLGLTPNYDNACSRIYLDMNPTKYGTANVFEGSMTLVYVGTCVNGEQGICQTRMSTGYGAEDARYNRWTAGDWDTAADGSVNSKKQFHAIFEDDGYGSYILKMDYFQEVDIGDGKVGYRGWAELYSKMFRTSTSSDVHRVDQAGDCYNTGTYISAARQVPDNRPSIRCWFVKTGPFSCRPNGDLLINATFTDINLATKSYKCYRKLGTIYSMDVGRAFNTSDVTKL